MEKRVLIQNAKAIVTCDSEDRVYKDADILIEGAKIIEIGKNIIADNATVIDGRDKFIYPGLVTTHHHFFQTFVRNLLSIDYVNISVMEWLDVFFPIIERVNEDVIYHSAIAAMADALKHGCTTIFDHMYCFPKSASPEMVDRQMDAAELLGIRYHAGRATNTIPHSEGSPIPDSMVETTDYFLSDCERLIKKYHDPNPFSMSQIVIAPCQPINSYKETFMESAKLARKHGLRLHTHLGEGEDEGMVARWGKRSVAWCEEIGFLGEDVWLAHGWDIQPDEYKVLGRTGTGVAHCPGPAVLGGFPILPMLEMQKAGVRVSLGTDGSATCDSANPLDSLRMAYLMQTYFAKVRGGCPTPYDILKIATKNGAETLGRHDLGSLELGKGADLFMIDTNTVDMIGTLHDPKNVLARVGITGPVWLTMVNGKVVWKEGEFPGLDEHALSSKANDVCKKVFPERYEN
ncbi:amidohydrolase [Clostridia bacterium]|nr:amidohydrolase [Clostridia bacterium]